MGSANYVDPLGRTILSGTIFNPATDRPVVCSASVTPTPTCVTQGLTDTIFDVRDPFPNNMIPSTTALDPVALKVLALVPLPKGPNAAKRPVGK